MGNYLFSGCSFRVEWHWEGGEEHHHIEAEMDYPGGPRSKNVHLDASILSIALKNGLGLEMTGTRDNYSTFDISENIAIHPSVWYNCLVVDGSGTKKVLCTKVSAIRHIGADLEG